MTRVQKHFSQPSRTKQSFKDETNVNNIMSKYLHTGLIDHVNQHQGQYGDFITSPDFHAAMNRVTAANEAFASLPAPLRARFYNSAPDFLEFVQNPDNIEEMQSMGLIPKTARPDVSDPAAVTPDTPDPGTAPQPAEPLPTPT